MTLSQTALARHLAVSTRWIRKQGAQVVWRGERWERIKSNNPTLVGYRLVTKLPTISRTVLSFPGDPDLELRPGGSARKLVS